MFQYFIALKEEEGWNLIRPIYRELDESVNLGKVNSYLVFIVKRRLI